MIYHFNSYLVSPFTQIISIKYWEEKLIIRCMQNPYVSLVLASVGVSIDPFFILTANAK